MTKSEFLFKFFVFWIVYVVFLQVAAFIQGAPTFFSADATLKQKIGSYFGLGTFTGVPEAVVFITGFAFAAFLIYAFYELWFPTK